MSYSWGRRNRVRTDRLAPWFLLAGLAVSACTATTEAAGSRGASAERAPSKAEQASLAAPRAGPLIETAAPMQVASTTAPDTRPAESDSDLSAALLGDDPPDVEPARSGAGTAPTPSSTSISTTAPAPDIDVHDPDCVAEAPAYGALDTVLSEDAATLVSAVDLWVENDLVGGGVTAGDLVDVCVGNGVDDITGAARIAPDDAVLNAALVDDVKRQQEQLNELFAGYAIAPLDVDGVAGPRTRQRLCAARSAVGLPTSTSRMQPGSTEHLILFSLAELPTPRTTAVESERWILIDRTCQIMFTGEGRDTLYVFPTSTGTAGFETRDQDRTEAFRFNPAADNGGWHDSTDYPVGVDNPLNGNMYKPLYFDLGQAIHGATNVPASPASKGCARLQVGHQDLLLGWLGLGETTAGIWRADEIRVTVNVQGEYVAR